MNDRDEDAAVWTTDGRDGTIEIAEEQDVIFVMRDHIRQVVALNSELLYRLLDERHAIPGDFGTFLEDVANTYLDLADLISERRLEERLRSAERG